MLPTRRPRALNLDVEASRSVVIAIWLSHVWGDSARGQDTGDGGHNGGSSLLIRSTMPPLRANNRCWLSGPFEAQASGMTIATLPAFRGEERIGYNSGSCWNEGI